MTTADEPPALLLIAHGTRDPRGAQEMDTLLALLRHRHPAPVAVGWLEDFAEPHVPAAVARLAGEGVRRVISIPFLNFRAGHAKTDVPAELAEARAAHPQLSIAHGRILGLHPALFALARARIDAVSNAPARGEETLVVTGSGSSHPHANSDLAKAARLLAEGTGHRWVEYAFAGVTWPRIDTVLERVARAGGRRVVLFSWSLLAGRLEQSVSAAAYQASEGSGPPLVDAGRFGPDPLVADVVMDRYREVLEGDPRMNCDLCA